MLKVALAMTLGLGLLTNPGAVWAQTAAPPTTGATAAPSTAAAPANPGDDLATAPRRAPAPVAEPLPAATREALKKGDAAVLARDYAGAVTAYQEAIRSSPQSALPHYRMGQAQILSGQGKEAELSYASAVRFSGKDLAFRRKVLFCLADLAERQKNTVLARERYDALATEPVAGEPALPFAASALERKKRLSEAQQLATDSILVKGRIEKRLKEAEGTPRKSP